MTLPRCDSVAALYALQNSMMLTPCWPRAGPIGGAGVASPALIWSLIRPATFFLGGMMPSVLSWADAVGDDPVASPPRVRGGSPAQSDLGDLVERELDRGLPAEDRDEHLELLP